MTDKELARLRVTLGNVDCPEMKGDNLAITLCTAFEDSDEEPDDETGWPQSAIDGCNRALDAIHAHYAPTIEHLRARAEAAEAAWDGMRAQAETAGAELSESRIRWLDALDLLEARWSKRDAQREVAHRQEMDALRSELTGWRERAKEAEAERDRLREVLQKIADATEPPILDPYKDRCIHRRSLDQECVYCTRAFARAALSGGDDG